ncbi:MAG: hypothetical protein LBB58_01415, partial [Cellulomonadaceae bacterium]|nr:hypothetical protein [Cellulomonadaceae bacterium]
MIISLLIDPLLQVLLLVAVLTTAGVADIRDATYASIILAFGLTVLSGAVSEVTYDRQIGVVHDVVGHGVWNWWYWVSKLLLSMLLGVIPAILSAFAVFLLDGYQASGGFTAGIIGIVQAGDAQIF